MLPSDIVPELIRVLTRRGSGCCLFHSTWRNGSCRVCHDERGCKCPVLLLPRHLHLTSGALSLHSVRLLVISFLRRSLAALGYAIFSPSAVFLRQPAGVDACETTYRLLSLPSSLLSLFPCLFSLLSFLFSLFSSLFPLLSPLSFPLPSSPSQSATLVLSLTSPLSCCFSLPLSG